MHTDMYVSVCLLLMTECLCFVAYNAQNFDLLYARFTLSLNITGVNAIKLIRRATLHNLLIFMLFSLRNVKKREASLADF
jgi:hypothetical protein